MDTVRFLQPARAPRYLWKQFTFGFTAARLSERRLLIIDEANAIGTTFLRADFLPRAKADGVKELLREYVALRGSAR